MFQSLILLPVQNYVPIIRKIGGLYNKSWFLVTCLVLISGCQAFQNLGYRLYPSAGPSGEQRFQFRIGYDTLKEMGGLGQKLGGSDENERNVMTRLLENELIKLNYCPKGYEIDDRTWTQGGGYLTYHGYCQ